MDGKEFSAADLQREGLVYKVSLPDEEYLLLEQRDSHSHYYNRDQPAAGLLVWHIRPQAGDNSQEENKLVELVCADGRDALDVWAHDSVYCAAHGGNLGDETDPFDGVRFIHLERGGRALEIHQQGGACRSPFLRWARSGQEMAGGVYLYRLEAGDRVQTRQMLLAR